MSDLAIRIRGYQKTYKTPAGFGSAQGFYISGFCLKNNKPTLSMNH